MMPPVLIVGDSHGRWPMLRATITLAGTLEV